MKALGRGWVPASLLRALCQWADSDLREAGASDLTLGPLTLCTGESGGRSVWAQGLPAGPAGMLRRCWCPRGPGGSWAGLNHRRSGIARGGGRHRSPVAGSPSALKPQPGFSTLHEEDSGWNCCPAPMPRAQPAARTGHASVSPPSRAPGQQRLLVPWTSAPSVRAAPWSPPGLAGGPSEGRTTGSLILKLLMKNHELHFFGN